MSYKKKPGCEIQKAMQKTRKFSEGKFCGFKISEGNFKMRPMSKELCLICKGGRALCGISPCPLLQRIRIQLPIQKKLSKDLFGPSPSIFVGHQGYPDVFLGPMTSLDPKNASLLDDPSRWYGSDFNEIIRMRSLLVRSKRRQGIRERTEFIEKSMELALATKPTDIEVEFNKKPIYSMRFSPISQPMGPSGVIERFKITENPKIPKKVDSVVSDEIKAVDAVFELYKNKFDVYYLTTVLSSGAMGMHENRKLVPTRWSITCVDDIIAKELMKEIRDFPEINEFLVYENTYLENHFEILMIPGKWEFEQFEAWAPKTLWTLAHEKPVIQEEYESYKGRTQYAFKEGGGYYAGRIAAVEKLYKMRKQARVVIFREISEGYVIPVGVWEVRENVRRALEKNPQKFGTLKDALGDIKSRLRIPISEYIKRGEILKQRRINEYI